MSGDRERVLRFVRRARRRLEAVRLLRAAAQGALAGGALGVLSLLLTRAIPALPWALLLAGAAGGAALALFRQPIGLAAAALYLDGRLRTAERFATVATLPPDPLTFRVASEIPDVKRLPRSPVPREAALVPLALFLLFAAGLLPAAQQRAEPLETLVVVPTPAAPVGATEVDPEALAKLAKAAPLAPEEIRAMREAIENRVRRPEERRAARAALDRAAAGEATAAAEVVEALAPRTADRKGAALLASAYPEAQEFVRAYRRALEEEQR